ncbi:MAG: LLM class flavin-dependent oxidoreductase [Gordonia sp.]|uniref:LLM class flavin-dependent oxidoreductase n=1 Tax=Gordonia sp. (in: high G+C Gram-positive bacteria) TaxID=84139 RepID=UPI000C6272C3|nr:LLM class flavin-dependent oxidoreductase [Gordonia sp. (in: high G+C Gram-positive bacteria)]MAU84049.1 LLM class flavin-dependent oxidoreductase [Gordonia sp. (in: high G+C Gram-positive bacteria)]
MISKFGGFIPPFHRPGQDPAITFQRDLQLITFLDNLGFDEAWVGEHHSAGWANISSPELFIAAAAERSNRIALGTGVVSLPYHHPLTVANRIVQLDHQSRGRVMFGVGAGVLASDAHMFGINAAHRHRMMEDSLETILQLLRTEEPVTRDADWFSLHDAQLHLRPRDPSGLRMALAGSGSERSMLMAGRHGIPPLTFATNGPGARPLAELWTIAETEAERCGHRLDRGEWRLVISAHIAETRARAVAEAREGVIRWQHEYFRDTIGVPISLPAGREVETLVERGSIIVGSVDDAIEAIEKLQVDSGGFGTLLVTSQEWATWEQAKYSYELIAKYVAPHFTGTARSSIASQRWVMDNRHRFGTASPTQRGEGVDDSSR